MDDTAQPEVVVVVARLPGGDGRRKSSTPPEATTYRVYTQRWWVLLTVVLLNISNAGLWINLAPVSYKAADYFDVGIPAINWFSLTYLFMAIPFCFISTFTVNQLGLRACIHIGALLNCIGGVVRAVATAGFLPKEAEFPMSMAGQVVAAVAQNFILYLPTKVSQLWFPESFRALSTTILSMSNPFGVVVAEVASPLLVPKADQLPTLNYFFGGLALLAELVTLVCVTRSMPPTPPSHSAASGERERAPYLQQLKDTFTCLPYLLLLLALGCGIGLFSSLATVTQQILCPLGYDDLFSGVINAVMLLCGFAGSAVSGVAAGRTKAYTPITKLLIGCTCLFTIIMMEMFLVPDQHAIVAVACGLFGFFGVGAYPVGLELAVEVTYPVEETISTAFLFMSGQAQAVVIIAMVTLLSRDMQSKYEYLEVCTSGENPDLHPRDYSISVTAIMVLFNLMGLLIIIFFNTPYKRLEAESASNQDIPSTSSSHSLTATSGYALEAASRNTTSLSSTKTGATALPKNEKELGEAASEVDQCH